MSFFSSPVLGFGSVLPPETEVCKTVTTAEDISLAEHLLEALAWHGHAHHSGRAEGGCDSSLEAFPAATSAPTSSPKEAPLTASPAWPAKWLQLRLRKSTSRQRQVLFRYSQTFPGYPWLAGMLSGSKARLRASQGGEVWRQSVPVSQVGVCIHRMMSLEHHPRSFAENNELPAQPCWLASARQYKNREPKLKSLVTGRDLWLYSSQLTRVLMSPAGDFNTVMRYEAKDTSWRPTRNSTFPPTSCYFSSPIWAACPGALGNQEVLPELVQIDYSGSFHSG